MAPKNEKKALESKLSRKLNNLTLEEVAEKWSEYCSWAVNLIKYFNFGLYKAIVHHSVRVCQEAYIGFANANLPAPPGRAPYIRRIIFHHAVNLLRYKERVENSGGTYGDELHPHDYKGDGEKAAKPDYGAPDPFDEIEQDKQSVEDQAVRRDLIQKAWDCLEEANVTDEQGEMFRLYIGGYTYAEISRKINLPYHKVREDLIKLKEIVEECFGGMPTGQEDT